MSEVKTRFPVVTNAPKRFPVATQGKPDTLSDSIAQGQNTMKYNKADVDFEHPASGMDSCKDCFSFDPNWSCNKVNGQVRPEDWCNEFTKLVGMGLPRSSNTTNNLPQTGVKKMK